MGYYIGIDLGTSSVKLVLADGGGHVLSEASQEYTLLQPTPGFKEIEAQTWWKAVASCMDALLEGQDRSKVRAIGITGQMHSLVLLDENGEPVRPVLMWNDTRTGDMIPALKEKIQKSSVPYIAGIISTGSPAANLCWVKENETENFSRTRRFLIGPDYLVYRFTGVEGTDFCEASTSSLYDLIKREWSEDMLRIVGADRGICPPVRGSAAIAGKIAKEIAVRFDLPEDVKVIVGTGDNPAASLPTGCLTGGYPVLSLGTSGVLMFPRKAPDFEAKGKNILFSFDGEEVFTLTQGAVQSCGSGYSWLVRNILEIRQFGEADKGIALKDLGHNPLLFYPHLVGDKTIYQDPALRGAFLGLGTETTRDNMIQAYMEGIAFAVRQLAEEMGVMEKTDTGTDVKKDSQAAGKAFPGEYLRVIGGGSKSNVWMQIIADVLGVPVLRMQGNPSAGFGMAMLAAYAAGEAQMSRMFGNSGEQEGVFSKNQEKTVSGSMFVPDAERELLYERQYRRYLRIHDALKMIG